MRRGGAERAPGAAVPSLPRPARAAPAAATVLRPAGTGAAPVLPEPLALSAGPGGGRGLRRRLGAERRRGRAVPAPLRGRSVRGNRAGPRWPGHTAVRTPPIP